MPNPPLRIGLVGTGRWGQAYIRTLAILPDVTLAATYNSSFAPSVFECDNLDGLIVATPPSSHAALARAAFERRIPVLIEKPMTLDLAEARELAELFDRVGLPAMVDHTHLFHPAYEGLKAIINTLGGPDAVKSIRAEAGNRGPVRSDASVLWDWGAHDVAMILDLMNGKPTTVCGYSEPAGDGEHVQLTFSYANGTRAEIDVCNGLDHRIRSLSVDCGDKTVIYYDTIPAKLRCGSRAISVSPDLPLTRVILSFVESIRSGQVRRSGLDVGLSVVEILAACERSIACRETVTL